MIRRIILENYMSHARTVIEPAPGLTVLVGPNNCGKSAVVSALQTLCGDIAGDFMVRHGERTCKVTVETDDGHEITWRRKGGSVSYVIDGREIHRSGRGNLPDDLHDHLRLAKVEARGTGDKFDVHFALQKSPIFLIDNEGRAAAFFSTSSDAERLLEVQKRHKSKAAEANTEQKLLSAALSRLDRQLDALGPIDAVNAALKEAEATFDQLTAEGAEIAARAKLSDSIAACERSASFHGRRRDALRPLAPPPELGDATGLDRACVALDRGTREVRRRRAQSRALSALVPPPDLPDAAALEGTVVCLDGARHAFGRIQRRAKALRSLMPPPSLADEQPLGRACNRLEELDRQIARGRRTYTLLAALCDPPKVVSTSALEDTVRRLGRADDAARRARHRHAVVAPVQPPPEEWRTEPLENLIRRYSDALGSAASHGSRLEQIGAGLDGVAAEVRRWFEGHPICPLCGAPADADRVLGGGHAHG